MKSWILICHELFVFYLLLDLRLSKIPWKNNTKVIPIKQIRGFVNSNQHTLEYNQLTYLQRDKKKFFFFWEISKICNHGYYIMHKAGIIKIVPGCIGPGFWKFSGPLGSLPFFWEISKICNHVYYIMHKVPVVVDPSSENLVDLKRKAALHF
jgi:hypothetical protein